MKKFLMLVAVFASVHVFAQSAPVAANVGQTITISASVSSGTAPFTWTWFKNDARWTPASAPVVSADGKTAVVTITNAQLSDAGTYLVNVYNSAGNVNTPSAALTVAQVVVVPAGATLTITAK